MIRDHIDYNGWCKCLETMADIGGADARAGLSNMEKVKKDAKKATEERLGERSAKADASIAFHCILPQSGGCDKSIRIMWTVFIKSRNKERASIASYSCHSSICKAPSNRKARPLQAMPCPSVILDTLLDNHITHSPPLGMSYPKHMDSPLSHIDDSQLQQLIKSKAEAVAELNTRFEAVQGSLSAWLATQESYIALLRVADKYMPYDTTTQGYIEKVVEENKNLLRMINQSKGFHTELLNGITAGNADHPEAASSGLNENLGVAGFSDHGTAAGGASENYEPGEGDNMTQSQEEYILDAKKHLEDGQTEAPNTSSGNADDLKTRLAVSSENMGFGIFIGPHIMIAGYGETAPDTTGRITRRVNFACLPEIHCQAHSHDPGNEKYIPHQFTIIMDASDLTEKLLVSGFRIGVCMVCNDHVKYVLNYCQCHKDRCPPCLYRWLAELQQRFDELSATMGKNPCSECGKVAKQHLLCCMLDYDTSTIIDISLRPFGSTSIDTPAAEYRQRA
ncbi:uncharacterized protein MYCFIDRAFT_179591 [Pseudocercospora fijiensis CIRAD86]|uniref:Uncharacterized protein n=1 Tax=Pseudocercospora fijiensis (strain CIRAD86) TaxID=383855 RepID=M3AL12_PSEFD|nr:uncharacterized protein MYCFIDRAFT_179591 [Pseudocercospora fijiensis CIRAD86]EME78147.1 hypothetical protein MYCFIDRAFT_179591 [Pseudocercospora fijiensis CIRAD86]